jgi:nucleoside-diphosphate-sugar epimerase
MATLYGDNDPGNVGRLLRAIDRGRFIWIGDGQNYKSLLHVDDAAAACVVAATQRQLPSRRTFNIATEPCSMRAIVSTLATALGRPTPSLRLPAQLPLAAAAFAGKVPGLANRAHRIRATLEKWLSDDVFDAKSFRDAFGWHPAVPLSHGLSRQVAQYRLTQNQAASVHEPINDGASQASRASAA